MSTLFFTSDQHFYHKNIITYSNRPFESVDEMNDTIINNYNSVVSNKDIVYILGDFSFEKDQNKNFNNTLAIFKRLNGHKNLIYGNHDLKFREFYNNIFDECYDYKEIKYNKKKIILCHFPIQSWNGMHRGSWHLHGHCHSSLNASNKSLIKQNKYRYDVGVDNTKYYPISFEELEVKFTNTKI